MHRMLVTTGVTLAVVLALIGCAYAAADDYAFEAVQPEIKTSNVATLAVRLIHKTTKKPVVSKTVIVHTRIEMAPGEGHQMTSAIAPLPSPQPGVFAFKAPLAMEGRWLLSIAAKIEGEPEIIEGEIIFRTVR